MSSSPEQLARRWFEEIWNQRRFDTIDELFGERCVIHDAGTIPGDVDNAAQFRGLAQGLHHAISDIRFAIEDTVAQGEHVVMRVVVTGKHTGEGLGVPPTNRHVRVTGMVWGTWRGGKLAEGWNSFDMLSLFEQLGAVKRPS
jgi:steroid delta-isomerase-like uncharacterized protein